MPPETDGTPSMQALAEMFKNVLQTAMASASPPNAGSSSTATACKPAQFSVKEYKHGTSTVEDYFRHFDLALQLSKIPEEQHGSYAILHMGNDLFSALKFLVSPLKSEDLSYATIKDTLIRHFDKSKNKYAESIKFRQVLQNGDETVANFSLRLREAATYCEYGTFLDRMLLEQFLFGLKTREMCNVIIAKKPGNFAAAYELAQSLEIADCAVAEMKTSSIEPKTEETHKLGYVNNSQKRRVINRRPTDQREAGKCNGCGGMHPRTHCRFRNAICHNCKKKGHIARVCMTQTAQIAVQDSCSSSDESIEELNNVNIIHQKKSPGKIMISVNIDRKTVPMELDTGAPCSMMNVTTQ
ncbi:uncharacterized protein LOC142219844 [Haematobia irritans]|uniref:uncharacterized protein LOC142219844 n=1 Tax=Haematobia irritans TaxID=7368 RepID=UPI003F4FDA02